MPTAITAQFRKTFFISQNVSDLDTRVSKVIFSTMLSTQKFKVYDFIVLWITVFMMNVKIDRG